MGLLLLFSLLLLIIIIIIIITSTTEGGRRLCFHPFLSLCLSVCVQDISKSSGWIQMKFGGQVGCVTRPNWLDFGEEPDPATKIFKVILYHWEIGPKTICSTYLKKLCTDSDETWWTRWVCDEEELIQFWWRSESGSGSDNFWSDSSPLRDVAKLIYSIARYLKKLWTNLDETWWTSWVCDKDKFIRFWWRSESRSAYENDFFF